MTNPESIRLLCTEANTSAGGVRSQPCCVTGCQANKQTATNWVMVEIRVRRWPWASTSLLVPHHHQRPLLVQLLAQQMHPHSAVPPCEISLQF